MNNLPKICLSNIFSNLSLGEINKISLVCKKFDSFISSEIFLNTYLPLLGPESLEKAKLKFLKKFASKLSIRQIVDCNYNHSKDEMIQAGFFNEINYENILIAKNHLFIRLIYSITSSLKDQKRVMENLTDNLFGIPNNSHSPIKDVKFNLQDICAVSIFNFQFFIQEFVEFNKQLINNSKFIDDDKKTLLSYTNNHTDTRLKFRKIIINNYCRLENLSSHELVEFYTNLWIKYAPKQPKHLRLDMYGAGFMPSEIFKGFCNYVNTIDNNIKFIFFESYYLCNNDVENWNSAFKERKVKDLNMSFGSDLKKETLLQFISIIKNKSLKPSVNIVFLINNRKFVDNEVKQLFANFKNEKSNNVQKWLFG